MEEGVHPIPFRTRKLSPPSPMILRTLAWESRPMPALIFTGMQNRIPTHHAKGPGEKSPGPSCVCRRGRAVAAYDWAIATVLLGARMPLALRSLTVLPLSAWPAYPSVSRFYLSFCPTMGPRVVGCMQATPFGKNRLASHVAGPLARKPRTPRLRGRNVGSLHGMAHSWMGAGRAKS